VRTLIVPVVWPETGTEGATWQQLDDRLAQLRDLGVRPIAMIVDEAADELNADFPDRIAQAASELARRYPHLDGYVPVHHSLVRAIALGATSSASVPEVDIVRAIVNQAKATILAMRAVRDVNPAAQFIQAERVGYIDGSFVMARRAEFENERRWLPFDLVSGLVDREHALFDDLIRLGVSEEELLWFRERPCPPELMAIEHGISSDRFLDHRIERYPAQTHRLDGDVGPYADIDAAQVKLEGITGMRATLRTAWDRFRTPLVLVPGHVVGPREEQMRWLRDAWVAATEVRASGANVQAVCVPALAGTALGDSQYVPGPIDRRGAEPRETAIAPLLRQMSQGQRPRHPVLEQPGWWERPIRLTYPPVMGRTPDLLTPLPDRSERPAAERPILIAGAGKLGRAFALSCALRGLPFRLLSRAEMDIADPAAVERMVLEMDPWAVINAAGYTRVHDAELEPVSCLRDNARGPQVLARVSAAARLRMVTFSSAAVFSGEKDAPYEESDEIGPSGVYAESLALGEHLALDANPEVLVVRTAALFSPWSETCPVRSALSAVAVGQTVDAVDDVLVSPTYVPDLVNSALDLMIDGEGGVWHLANPGRATWAEFLRTACETAGLDASLIRGRSTGERPISHALDSERGRLLPSQESAIERFVLEAGAAWSPIPEHHGADAYLS